MTEDQKKILKGIQGFIEYAMDKNQVFEWTLFNILHDAEGILNKEKCFSPRTLDYGRYLEMCDSRKGATVG